MSHDELVERAVRWLSGSQRCLVVLREFSWWGGEEPDAMGWKANGSSILVECKASRSDFHADKRKTWRRIPDFGMGMSRYYLTPKGLLMPDDIPTGWGLLEVRGKIIRKLKAATPRTYGTGPRIEIRLLVNVANKLLNGWKSSSIIRPISGGEHG